MVVGAGVTVVAGSVMEIGEITYNDIISQVRIYLV